MRRLAAAAGLIAIVLLAAFGTGFAGFVAVAHHAATPPPEADGIVVLTGGADRVETGMHLLLAGRAKLLLVSGVAHGAALTELLHRAGLEDGPIATRITLGRVATTTLGNATETAEWVRVHDIRSLIVVTAGFHMPRALLELRRAMPGMVFHPMPVQPQAISTLGSFRVLTAEYIKLLAAWAGLSQVIRQPVSMVLHPCGQLCERLAAAASTARQLNAATGSKATLSIRKTMSNTILDSLPG